MTITIKDLKFQCILGILDFERTIPQDVLINIEIQYIYKKNTFINYAEVSDLVKREMQKCKFLLIEDALEHLSKKLKETFSLIQSINLKIAKPTILPDCQVSVSDFYSFHS